MFQNQTKWLRKFVIIIIDFDLFFGKKLKKNKILLRSTGLGRSFEWRVVEFRDGRFLFFQNPMVPRIQMSLQQRILLDMAPDSDRKRKRRVVCLSSSSSSEESSDDDEVEEIRFYFHYQLFIYYL
jgi:hypothetical protein